MRRKSNTEYSTVEQLDYLTSSLDFPSIEPKLAEDIVSLFWKSQLFNSLIANTVYLKLLKKYVTSNSIKTFSRYGFYHYLDEVVVGSGETSSQLSKMAFSLELLQQNSLALTESEKIISTDDLGTLIDNQILKLDNNQLSFYHPSIHSYYSASYLLNIPRPIEFLSSLITINGEVFTFPQVWYEVIAFALDFRNSDQILHWLISILKKHPGIVDENLLNSLRFVDFKNKLNTKQRESLFGYIFKLYENKQIWLPDSAESILATIATDKSINTIYKALHRPYKTETEKNVIQGNSVGVIDEILSIQPELIAQDETWHTNLIAYANDASLNGVLQRRALRALRHYKRKDDVDKLAPASNHPDRLVHEAFLIFCYEVAPNSKKTITYLVEGLLKDSEIYSRYGFYAITSASGLHYFLSILGSKEACLYKFLSGESIFNDNGRHEDDKIIALVKKFNSRLITNDLQKFIYNAYKAKDGYYASQSYFLNQLIDILLARNPNYAEFVVQRLKGTEKLYAVSPLLAKTITIENYQKILGGLQEISSDIQLSSLINLMSGEGRQDIYDDAVKRGLISPPKDKPRLKTHEERTKEREESIYKDFHYALEPKEGQYITNVFSTYVRNKEILNHFITETDLSRLKFLAINLILDDFEPSTINLKINNRDVRSGTTNYTITQIAGYYGDAIKVAQTFESNEELNKRYRKKFIDFLPYAHDDDKQAILEIIGTLNETELSRLNEVYLNKTSDVRYYLPNSYISLVESYAREGTPLKSAIPVLISFIKDDELSVHERQYSFDALENLLSEQDTQYIPLFRRLNTRYKNKKEFSVLSERANRALVLIYKDKRAAYWRFNEVKKRAEPFVMETGFHSVGSLENELHDKTFGTPLTQLDASYLNRFFNLLDFSLDILAKDKNGYLNYVTYIWSLTYEYLERLAKEHDITPFVRLERWYSRNAKKVEGANWFENRLENLRKVYASESARIDTVDGALQRMEELLHDA